MERRTRKRGFVRPDKSPSWHPMTRCFGDLGLGTLALALLLFFCFVELREGRRIRRVGRGIKGMDGSFCCQCKWFPDENGPRQGQA